MCCFLGLDLYRSHNHLQYSPLNTSIIALQSSTAKPLEVQGARDITSELSWNQSDINSPHRQDSRKPRLWTVQESCFRLISYVRYLLASKRKDSLSQSVYISLPQSKETLTFCESLAAMRGLSIVIETSITWLRSSFRRV